MAPASIIVAQPMIAFTNLKPETQLICQRIWMSEIQKLTALLQAKISICIHRNSHRPKLLLTQGMDDNHEFEALSPTFSVVGAKGTALITEMDAGTRDAICWSWPVSALYIKYTQLIIAFGLLQESE